jgi:hypothetical protein
MTTAADPMAQPAPQQEAVRLWLYLGRLHERLQHVKTEPERKQVREHVRELVRDIGKVEGADPIVRGKILQHLEAVERDPSSAPELLKRVAEASCHCLHLVPGLDRGLV